jgi:hypothetical protein
VIPPSFLPALLRAILANWKFFAGLAIIAALGVMLLLAKGDARHWRKTAQNEKMAHELTVSGYRKAAAEAKAADLENVARVQAEQATITERIEDEYQGKLATAADRYDRLRAQAAAYSGSPRTADMSEASEATCRAYAGTDCDGIPALLKAAQDNTDKLIGLQAWTAAQASVAFGDTAP